MSETDPLTIWAPEGIRQTTFERLAEMIRAAAIDYLTTNPNVPWLSIPWREKPWMDGVMVDLDETYVAEHMARYIVDHADPATAHMDPKETEQ